MSGEGMARVVEGDAATGTWARPATPQMEKVDGEWVSRGWNELEHRGWVFKGVSRPCAKDGYHARAELSEQLVWCWCGAGAVLVRCVARRRAWGLRMRCAVRAAAPGVCRVAMWP